jgi:hypothetical protein
LGEGLTNSHFENISFLGNIHGQSLGPGLILWYALSNEEGMRWAGNVARIGEGRDVYMVSVEKLEEKRPLGRPRRRWEDNIKMDRQEVGCGGMGGIELAQDRDRW